MADLAALVGLSQNHLARRFRTRFGMTVQQYLLARRIELATELLEGTDLAVGAVARRVGIPDPQYFNKQFRRVMASSPSDHRQACVGIDPNRTTGS